MVPRLVPTRDLTDAKTLWAQTGLDGWADGCTEEGDGALCRKEVPGVDRFCGCEGVKL